MTDTVVNDASSIHSETSAVESHPAYPFIDDDADVILRSSSVDPVDFRVHRIILSKAASFFKDMFSLPPPVGDNLAPDDEYVDGKPVVKCAEDSTTLRLVLLFIYPGEDPTLLTLTEVSGVLEAALKFEIDFLAAKVRSMWTLMVHDDPLRSFAIACLRKWPREALEAAKVALQEPVWPLEPPLCEEFDLVSANTILRLEKYHRECADAARTLAIGNREQWAQVLTSEQCAHCSSHNARHSANSGKLALVNWMNKYLTAVAEDLASRPAPSTVTNPELVQRTIREAYGEGQAPCELSSHMMGIIDRFVEHLSRKLEVALCGVDLVLEF